MAVHYEWDMERVQTDPDPDLQDIIDHDHSDKLDFTGRDFVAEPGEFKRLVLVRDVWTDGDLEDRSWAYVEFGKLPEVFTYGMNEYGATVPERFRRELERWIAKHPDHRAAVNRAHDWRA